MKKRSQEDVRQLMIYCGKWDDAPNIPGFSLHRSTIVPQIREYLGPSSTFLATIPVIGQPPGMVLDEYGRKRNFTRSPEPKPVQTEGGRGNLLFVVQKHQASHLHYDLRLELGGVLKSWAIPKGPSLNPGEKHLAVMVEDHPLDYRNFEGVIAEGNYGAGTVMIWDEGTYEPRMPVPVGGEEDAIKESLEQGHLTFVLHGKKLKGEFSLIKTKRGEKDWLLIKKNDDFATNEDIRKEDHSARTGRSMEEISHSKTD